MSKSKHFAAVVLVAFTATTVFAESRCPGNAASIPLRFVGRSLITIPVMLDNTGPYDFLLDTGAQITTVDTELAAELHSKVLGTTHVTGVGSYSQAAFAQLQLLQAGNYSIKTPLVLTQPLTWVRGIDHRVRGILGESFLEHYDFLIDYQHRILCLDETKQMQENVKGERVELTNLPHPHAYLPFTLPLIVSTRFPLIPDRELLLQLDSGTDVPVLFDCGKQFLPVQFFGSSMSHKKGDTVVDTFAALMPQNIHVGNQALHQIAFVTPVTAGKAVGEKPDVDGVLPTALFRRVFISYADHFAILQQ